MVAIPTGDFCVTEPVAGQVEDGVTGTAAEVTGACTVSCDTATRAVVVTATVITGVVAVATLTVDTVFDGETVLPILWKQ
jgi:hypothetical protein